MANKIDTASKRERLKQRRDPYWHKLSKGNYIGFRHYKGSDTWRARMYCPDLAQSKNGYIYTTIDLPGDASYEEAEIEAKLWFKNPLHNREATIKLGQELIAAAEELDDSSSFNVSKAIDRYVTKLHNENSEDSAHRVRQLMDRNVPTYIMGTEVMDLQSDTLILWRDGLVSDDLEGDARRAAQETANKKLSMLKAALNYAFEVQDKVTSDAAWRKVKPFKNTNKARDNYLTVEQVNRLLGKTTGAFHNLCKAAILTGCRYGELCHLTIDDFDPAAQTLQVNVSKTGPRKMHLSSAAVSFFKQLIAERKKNKVVAIGEGQGTKWLLVKDDGSQWKRSHQTRPWAAAKKKARLPAASVLYDLRHYHISMLLEHSDMREQAIAENTGTSPVMIQKHYGHIRGSKKIAGLDQASML